MPDYFTLLGLPLSTEIDQALLNSRYFALQRQCHPDNQLGKPPEERQAALEQTMALNAAYNTLKDSLKRAEYLLSLHDVRVNVETGGVKPCPLLLLEVMEQREQLAAVHDTEALKALESQALEEKEGAFRQFSNHYNQGNFLDAAQEAIRLKYAIKLLEEIKLRRNMPRG